MADRRLTVGVDGRELVDRPTGVGRYLTGLLEAWSRDSSDRCDWHVVVPELPADSGRFGPTVRWVVEPASTAGTRWEQARLRAALRRLGADVLFAVGYTAPIFAPCPVVPVIHDVSFFAHPEWFPRREGFRRRLVTRLSARRAATIVTVSEFSAQEIVRHLGIPRTRIVLAPPGAPPPDGAAGAPRAPLVLYVGSLFNRRRIPDLLDAFVTVRGEVPGARLVLVGDNRTSPPIDPTHEFAVRGLSDAVEWREYVPDAELAELYRRARVFAFLSDYEGFAMTPAEALAAGAAPVLLDTPVAREVYGEGVRLVPPDRAAIARALVDLLTDDRAQAAAVEAGRTRVARYSWDRSAAVIRRALGEAAGRP